MMLDSGIFVCMGINVMMIVLDNNLLAEWNFNVLHDGSSCLLPVH
jgi:hypothetical protein